MVRFFFVLFCLISLTYAADIIQKGTLAPTFSIRDLDNKYVKLRTWCGETLATPYKNKTRHTVILSFWSTQCLPCVKEIPLLQKFQEKHADKPIKIFCISVDVQGAPVVKPHVEKFGWKLPVLIDKYGVTAKKYGLVKTNEKTGRKEVAVPSLIVIDTMRTVLYAHTGFEEEGFIENLENIIWPAPEIVEDSLTTAGEENE